MSGTYLIRRSAATVLGGALLAVAIVRLSHADSAPIPHSLAEIGVSSGKGEIIGREAAIDPSAGGNPIPVSAAQLEHIFHAAVLGKLEAVDPAT